MSAAESPIPEELLDRVLLGMLLHRIAVIVDSSLDRQAGVALFKFPTELKAVLHLDVYKKNGPFPASSSFTSDLFKH